MSSRKNLRSSLVAGIIGLALFAASCSTNTDPETWADALEEGKVEQNFLASCEQADEDNSDTSGLVAYCSCSFGQLQETFADSLERFKNVESALRDNPELINDTASIQDVQLRADMRLAAQVLDGCEEQNL